MKTFEFHSKLHISSNSVIDCSDDTVKNETMLFNCDTEFAYNNGGPLTKSFLNILHTHWYKEWDSIVIDSRVHMSYKAGLYLCIEGWHLDDVPRTLPNGQPDHFTPEYKAEHCMALANAAIAPTEFAVGRGTLQDIEQNKVYYREWHPRIEKKIEQGSLQRFSAPDRKLIFFDWQTWHRGTATVKTGWRWFIRATRFTNRKPTNEVRRQVQVYVPFPNEGW